MIRENLNVPTTVNLQVDPIYVQGIEYIRKK